MKKSIWILGALLSIAAATVAIKKDPLKGHVANNKIEYFLSVEQGKFILIDRIVLDSRGYNVKGFYGWAAQGEDE